MPKLSFSFLSSIPSSRSFSCLSWASAAGYNYYGNERFYSGVGGRELKADIFVGTVYYQRLRHMVSDKFQVGPMALVAGVMCRTSGIFLTNELFTSRQIS